jgi:hypothetical protein
LASVVVGCFIWVAVPVGYRLSVFGIRSITSAVIETLCFIVPGVVVSYFVGTCVAGVFLVADLIRRALSVWSRRRSAGTVDEES